MMSVFEDGTTLGLYRDREKSCAEIAKFSKKDAETYRWLAAKAAGYLPMIAASLYSPPAPLGATYALMDQSREGRELWRYMQMSSHDLLCSLFEHDKVRMHFARVAGENLVSPDEKATGIGVFVFVAFLEAYGIGVPVGGSGKLTDALIASIREHGGEVLADTDVARIKTKNGRAAGVETQDGRSFDAKDGVIAALHPHDLGIDGRRRRARGRRRRPRDTQISEIGCITLHAALNGPLKFRAGAHVRAVMIELLPNKYDTIRKSFDCLRYGEFSTYPLVGLGSLTMFDASRAPPGKATMHVWDYVPYQRADGRSWDDTKHHYVKRMLEPHGELRRQRGRQCRRLPQRQPRRHGAHVVELPPRRPARHRRGDVPIRRPSPDAGPRHERGARLRAALSRRPVPAPGRRRVRRGPRGRDARVRGLEARFRESRSALMLTLYSPDNSKLMEVEALERSGNELLIKGKVFGAMPMTARLTPAEARKGLRLVNFKLVLFLLTFLLR